MVENSTASQSISHSKEVQAGKRFEFGKNWARFLTTLDDRRIESATNSLKLMLGVADLSGKTFVDIGSGSGLFSLAARRLGARVHSFDYDPHSVGCTRELRRRYFPDDPQWVVEEASALDPEYIAKLGKFDVVYSWGVLHHTGQMWIGLEHAHRLVGPNGQLFVAIYNDTGSQATRWRLIKKIYNQLPGFLKPAYALFVHIPNEFKAAVIAIVNGRFLKYVRSWWQPEPGRGMNRWHDIVDWAGGYPYEVASPDQMFDFYSSRGYALTKLHCGNVGLGCAEYVFRKTT